MSILVENLSYSYGGAEKKRVLSHIHLEIPPGACLAVLGPNGAGKTTLLSAVAGLLKPTEGRITYDGAAYGALGPRRLAALVGYVPQTVTPAFDYSVLDYVVTGCAPQIGTFERPKREHYEEAMGAIRQMGIAHLAEKSYKQISGGERQQVTIARVIAQKPRYILMDEPTAHLDYGNQIHVLGIIRSLTRQGFAVVFTTHNPDHVLLLGGRVAVIDREGELRWGDSFEIIREDFLKSLYRTELRITALDGGRDVCYPPGL